MDFHSNALYLDGAAGAGGASAAAARTSGPREIAAGVVKDFEVGKGGGIGVVSVFIGFVDIGGSLATVRSLSWLGISLSLIPARGLIAVGSGTLIHVVQLIWIFVDISLGTIVRTKWCCLHEKSTPA